MSKAPIHFEDAADLSTYIGNAGYAETDSDYEAFRSAFESFLLKNSKKWEKLPNGIGAKRNRKALELLTEWLQGKQHASLRAEYRAA